MKTQTDLQQPAHHQWMTDLCKQIPTVARCAGVEPWDQEVFAAVQKGRSEAEKIAASFVLSVWSGGAHSEWSGLPEFSAVEATARCDQKVVRVITEWMLDPFWP